MQELCGEGGDMRPGAGEDRGGAGWRPGGEHQLQSDHPTAETMALSVRLETISGPCVVGERVARVIFRGQCQRLIYQQSAGKYLIKIGIQNI